MSASTKALKVGVPPPLGAMNPYLAVWVFQTPVNVPELVTGDPEIVNSADGKLRPTLVTPVDPALKLLPLKYKVLPTR